MTEIDLFPLQNINGEDLAVVIYPRYCQTIPHLPNGAGIMLMKHAICLTNVNSTELKCERLYVETDVKDLVKLMEAKSKADIKTAETRNQQTIEDLIAKTAEKINAAEHLLKENKKLTDQLQQVTQDRDLLEKHLVARIGTLDMQTLRNQK